MPKSHGDHSLQCNQHYFPNAFFYYNFRIISTSINLKITVWNCASTVEKSAEIKEKNKSRDPNNMATSKAKHQKLK